jgi:hypothetical protein
MSKPRRSLVAVAALAVQWCGFRAPSYADVNALVEFFLKLGGHYADPTEVQGAVPLTTPSRKFARWVLAGSEAKFVARVPLPELITLPEQ